MRRAFPDAEKHIEQIDQLINKVTSTHSHTFHDIEEQGIVLAGLRRMREDHLHLKEMYIEE